MKGSRVERPHVVAGTRRRVPGVLIAAALLSFSCAGSKPAPAPVPTPSAPSGSASSAPPVRPEALAGDWLFEMTRSGESTQYSLHFSLTSGILAGSLTGPDGNAQELTKIALNEDKVTWDIDGPVGTLHYEGKVSGSSMKGTMKRSRSGRSDSGGSSSSGGGYSGGGGRGGRGGRGGGSRGGGGERQMTWSAYKSVAPSPGENAPPAPTPTPSAG